MDKKLFAKSAIMSALIVTMTLVLVNIPGVLADTPPYYKGPYKGFQTGTNQYVEVAQVGLYDYENPPARPYVCVLHQGYGYGISPWVPYGALVMQSLGWYQSGTPAYSAVDYGASGAGYAYRYVYPFSPYAWNEATIANTQFRNTQTGQIITPPNAIVNVDV